jgi:acyl-CoA hydrolase
MHTSVLPQPERKVSEVLRIVEVVFPNTTNHYGTMFGGKVLDLMDRAAFIAASKFTNLSMVTVSTEHIDFYTPIRHGHLVELVAKIVYTGRTSLTVKVDLFSENPVEKTRAHSSQGYFHMVAVSPEGGAVPIPQVVIEGAAGQEEWNLCVDFREQRKARQVRAARL